MMVIVKKFLTLSVLAWLVAGVAVLAATPSLGQDKPSQESKPAQGQQGQAPPGPQVTPQQVKDAQAIQNELDPDKQLQMVNDFATKYPDSPYLSDMYFFGAYAAQQKGDIPKIIDFGEKSLKAKNDNVRTLLLMASILPRPQVAQGAEAEKRLTEAEADANKVLQMIPQLPKPPNQPDDQFQKNKAAVAAEAHAALGMVHLQRATQGLTGPDAGELSKAEKEYQEAVSGPNPNAEDYFRLGEAYAMHNKTDEAIEAFTKASDLAKGGPLQTYAEQRLKALKEKKGQAATPPKQ
jgi:tetratricopeptide (TPR) repeat protein